MKIFLSYAEEDRGIAEEITRRLDQDGHEIFNWRDPKQRGKQILAQIERSIKDAEAFVAVLSTRFMRSDWCKRELGMAVTRESGMRTEDTNATFIHVVDISHTPPEEAGVLGNYDWVVMANPQQRTVGLHELAGRFASSGPLASGGGGQAVALSFSAREPVFRNREEELRKVINGVTNTAGPHFWLVVAPPQLGKSWLLRRISEDDALAETWVVRLADLRAQPADALGDVSALLDILFGSTPRATARQQTMRIAQQISRSERPHLCLLDNAELLSKETANGLRDKLNQIHRYVQDSGQKELHAAFIAASRRDDEWKGVTPLRLTALPLTEFNGDVVQQALHDLSAEMNRSFSPRAFRENAARAHHVTEGLPALLARCLQWIRTEQWIEMERLDTQQQFEEFADSYVQQELLTPACLLPAGEEEGREEALRALEHAYRVLTPYRLFTHSHLRYHLEVDSDFRAAVGAAGWALADLSQAIGRTALLRRPLSEPWKEIHGAIRRLLYRYFYRTDEQRAAAHTEARKFVEIWADRQAGTEQVVGLVECLWHEAMALRLREPVAMAQNLAKSARMLSRDLRETSITVTELREFAAERIRDDGEFEEAISNNDGLLNRLVDIVLNPGDGIA